MQYLSVMRRPWLVTVLLPFILTACGGGAPGEPMQEVSPPQGSISEAPLNQPAASVVIGQPNFNVRGDNQGGLVDANTLQGPSGLAIAPDGKLFVVDTWNNRIAVWAAVPQSNNAPASFAMGQLTLQSEADPANPGAFVLKHPLDISFGAGKMAVSDDGFHRVLIYNNTPSSSAATPDAVVGQPGFLTDTESCSATGLRSPSGVMITPDGRLIIADRGNHRVLIWNSVPADSEVAADVVIGQPEKDACTPNNDVQGRSNRTLFEPDSVWSDGTRLAVADLRNRRVLIWDAIPTQDHQAANIVLGQKDFSSGEANLIPSASNLNFLVSGPDEHGLGKLIASDGNRFVVADTANSRVLIWNTFPTANFQPADIVLGQPSMTSGDGNDENGDGIEDSPSNRTLAGPRGVLLIGSRLLVSDHKNHRVLIFDLP